MRKQSVLLCVLLGLILLNNINSYYTFSTNNLNTHSLQEGDLIFHNYYKDLVPGEFSHVQLYIGNGLVVESEPLIGVHINKVKEGYIYRVRAPNILKRKAITYALSKIGSPYSFNYTIKKVNGDSFYCSELVWNAYLAIGIDLDLHPGFDIKYGLSVFPEEVASDPDTYFIGLI